MQPETETNSDDIDLRRLEAEAEADAVDEAAPDALPKPDDDLPDIPTGELLRPICDVAAAVFVPGWHLQEAEIAALAEAYGRLIDKHLPEDVNLGRYKVELNALLLTAAIIGPRARLPRQLPPPEPEPEQEKKKETATAEPGRQAKAETLKESAGA